MATTPLGNMTAEQRDQWVEALINPVGYHQCHGAWALIDDEYGAEPGYCCLTVLAVEVLGLNPSLIEGEGDTADFAGTSAHAWLRGQLGPSFEYVPFSQRNDGCVIGDSYAPDMSPCDEDDQWSYDEIAEFIQRLPLKEEA